MVNIDQFASAGYTLELLARSEYHRQFTLGDYFRVEILPALSCGQARFYLTEEGVPTALVTWAWLSDEVERAVHATGRALTRDEWNCGDRLFFNDWITPYDNIREVLHDMTHTIFPNEIATSLRRNHDGTVRRVNRWTGVNIRNAAQEAKSDAGPKPAERIEESAYSHFTDAQQIEKLRPLVRNWKMIRDEYRSINLPDLDIDRDGKTHEDVFDEVAATYARDGRYGWLRGWGAHGSNGNWTQLGLMVFDNPVPFLHHAMAKTVQLLTHVRGIKVAALIKMKPGAFLNTHTHPELAEQGLLQMHLTLDAASENNFAYLNVQGEFHQHVPGHACVFDGSKPHFALNASSETRVILYLEFDPNA